MRSVDIDVHARFSAHVHAHGHGKVHNTYMTDQLTHINTHVHVHIHVHVPCTLVKVVLLLIQGHRASMQRTLSNAAATTSCLLVANTIPIACNHATKHVTHETYNVPSCHSEMVRLVRCCATYATYNSLCPGCPLCVFSSAVTLGACLRMS